MPTAMPVTGRTGASRRIVIPSVHDRPTLAMQRQLIARMAGSHRPPSAALPAERLSKLGGHAAPSAISFSRATRRASLDFRCSGGSRMWG